MVALKSNNKKIVLEYMLTNNSGEQRNNLYHKNISFDKINNVLLYPFNKEIHSLVRFRNILPFSIKKIVDLPLLGNVNKDAGIVLGEDSCDITINSNYKESLTDDIDSVILGDLSELSKIYKVNQTIKYSELAFQSGKNVISIELLDETIYKSLIETSETFNCKFLCLNDFINKKAQISSPDIHLKVPIISIIGTGPKVGKFTLQLTLKKHMERIGYKITNLCTEPQSFLFRQETIPIGNHNLLQYIPFDQQLNYIKNTIISIAQKEDPELLIISGQSGIVPYSKQIPVGFTALSSIITLLASKPDGVIICFNPNDEIEYIKRTISAIESFGYGKVFLCVMSNLSKKITRKKNISYESKEFYINEELKNKLMEYEKSLELPVVNILNESGIVKCITTIQKYFS